MSKAPTSTFTIKSQTLKFYFSISFGFGASLLRVTIRPFLRGFVLFLKKKRMVLRGHSKAV